MRLYLVVAEDLSPGLKMAQAVHAGFQFAQRYPHLHEYWFHESNNVAVLQTADLEQLADRLEEADLRVCRFHEPDLDDKLTAIAVEPAGRRALRKLKLAK